MTHSDNKNPRSSEDSIEYYYCLYGDFKSKKSTDKCPDHPKEKLLSLDTYNAVRRSISENEASDALRDEGIRRLFENQPTDKASLGMGVIGDDEFYYGTQFYHHKAHKWSDMVILSREAFFFDNRIKKTKDGEGVNEIREELGLDYEHSFMRESLRHAWSPNQTGFSVQQFVRGECPDLVGKDIYDRLTQMNKDYIFHVDARIHSLIAIYIMATYFLKLFSEVPRLHFVAEGESGKSTQCKLISHYAFNPIALGGFSEAYFYRCVSTTCGTIILDDIDDVPEELQRAIRHIDKVGYKAEFSRRGVMAQDRSGRPITDDFFCFFVKNSIEEPDKVSASRIFLIFMTHFPQGYKLKKFRRNAKPDQELRDMLYVWALQNWRKVKEHYETLEVPGLASRREEIASPLLAVAKTISEDAYAGLLEFLPDHFKNQKESQEKGGVWLSAIEMILRHHSPLDEIIRIQISELTTQLSEALGLPEDKRHSLSVRLGKEFAKRKAVFKYKTPKGRAHYEVRVSDLTDLTLVRGYHELLDIEWNTPNLEEWKKRFEKPGGLSTFMEGTGESNPTQPTT